MTMKCEYCDKKIEGIKRKYCNSNCRDKFNYRKNKRRSKEYHKKYFQEKLRDFCACGNKKYIGSKQCQKCHDSNKTKGRLSRLPK